MADQFAERLARYAPLMQAKPASPPAERDCEGQVPHQHLQCLAESLGGQPHVTAAGGFCQIDWVQPYQLATGMFPLTSYAESTEHPVAAFTGSAVEGVVHPASLLFFDTETTGLGGAGTVPFLIGTARFTPVGLVVRQWIIPDYGDEAASLQAFFAACTEESVLVSYNGASFDEPLLSDRLILHRLASSIPRQRHLDLLHTARRLFRRRLRDCSLGNLERAVLGIERHNDIPGYLVPSAYFTWLSDKSTDLLRQVVEHNRQDLISLALLYQLFEQIYRGEGELLDRSDDLYSLGRLYGRQRSPHRAVRALSRIDQIDGSASLADIALFRSFALKQAGQTEEAALIWNELAAGRDKTALISLVELAKWYEHRLADYPAALACACQAEQLASLGFVDRSADLDRRIARLRSRIPPSL